MTQPTADPALARPAGGAAPAQPVVTPRPRQRWLDALRGLAVLGVVFDHASYLAFRDAWTGMMRWWHIGAFAVTLIFLVTGYVIPASLGRGGSPARFWVSRAFRLYPMWAVVAAGALAVGFLGLAPLPVEVRSQPLMMLLANGTLLQSLLGVPALLVVLWTLSYQVAFYALATAAWRFGLHRRSAEIAVGLCALVVVVTAAKRVAGPIELPRTGWFVAVTLAVLGVALWAAVRRAGPAALAGSAVLVVVIVGLAARAQHADGWGLLILAMMFTGAALYQARQGEARRWRAAVAAVVLLAAAVVTGWGGGELAYLKELPAADAARVWFAGLASGLLVFAVAPLVRDRLIPRGLTLTGVSSYSVYLLQMGAILLLMPWLRAAGRADWWLQVVAFAGLLAVLLPVSYLSYRLIELPGQRLGKALVRRFTAAPRPVGERPPAAPDPGTLVSVIIPNYDKAKTLRACLESVYAQTHQELEVIVVDDASTDGSREIAAAFPCRLLAFDVNRGVSAARNAGAAAATGEVLFFVDSDIALDPGAIATALRILRERPETGVVQGIYAAQPLFADGPVEVYKTLFEHFWRRRRSGVADATLFALTAVPRRVFDEVGGFDEEMRDTQDIEFGTRLPSRYVIWMSDQVLGRHDDVDRFWPYLREHLRRARTYGALVARLLLGRSRHPEAGRASRRIDVAAVACMVSCALAALLLPLAVFNGWALLGSLALFAVFVAIDRPLWGFVRREKGGLFLVYFVAMHFVMHATEMAGMLAGAVHAVARPARGRSR
ncbi:glycosyltransferase [Nonomuraea typhae]|uniref:glycosyltransferase n=1 Tax=Nonomuraea typhae TaxID=2603600 RepID=UPI001CA5E152|nr:glycosyltransferase [Nonomuraea typhae]